MVCTLDMWPHDFRRKGRMNDKLFESLGCQNVESKPNGDGSAGLRVVESFKEKARSQGFVKNQRNDPTAVSLFDLVEQDPPSKGYFINHGVLMRRERPRCSASSDDWRVREQNVLPQDSKRDCAGVSTC